MHGEQFDTCLCVRGRARVRSLYILNMNIATVDVVSAVFLRFLRQ